MFDLSPLFGASFIVQIHVFFAVISFLLGIWMLIGAKGTNHHRTLGKIWVACLLGTAISSFWLNGIRMIGPFSPIHILSILAIFSVVRAVQHARAGRIGAHQKAMKGLFYYALVGAGLFTFLPGRLMNELAFG
jgi:uncharacterized membrane protein